MTTAAILRAARALIAEPGCWCATGATAVTADGREVEADHPDAVSWCIVGALDHVTNQCGGAYRSLAALVPIGLGAWNDSPGRTHAEVLALYDTAIAAAESEGRDG